MNSNHLYFSVSSYIPKCFRTNETFICPLILSLYITSKTVSSQIQLIIKKAESEKKKKVSTTNKEKNTHSK